MCQTIPVPACQTKNPEFSTMAFFCSPPKTRKLNRNHYSVASHDLHNHSYPSPDQEDLQEIQKTKQYRPSSKNCAFSANDVQTSTMTLRRLIESTTSLPPKTYTIVSSPLITEESILKCWKRIHSDRDRGNCVSASSHEPGSKPMSSFASHIFVSSTTNITFLSLQTRTNGRLRHPFSSPTVPCPPG